MFCLPMCVFILSDNVNNHYHLHYEHTMSISDVLGGEFITDGIISITNTPTCLNIKCAMSTSQITFLDTLPPLMCQFLHIRGIYGFMPFLPISKVNIHLAIATNYYSS